MENKTSNTEEIEIDLQRLFATLLDKAWLIGIVALLMAVAMFLGTFLMITPLYKSSAMFYVNNTDISVGGANLSLTASDISASRGLVDTYIVILNTRETMLDVIDYADVDLTYEALKGMVSAEAVDDTEVFRVTVTSPDPQQAEQIANAFAYILPKRIANIIEGSSAKVVDSAVVASAPSSPSYTRNTMMGFLVGFVLAAAVVVVMDLLNVSIRTEEDISRCGKHPVLAAVPDMTRGGKKHPGKAGQSALIGGGVSFAAAESYKLLRTKLQFSFVDQEGCRIIGISSALTGEGKSLSAVNLAYALSQLGERVLLVDCDMRRPSMSEKLPVRNVPGLSDYLTGQTESKNLIQLCGMPEDERAFHVIAAGQIPPNPVELLSSSRMQKMLRRLREGYDYIILDLPPVGEVSDALAASKLTDGMLLVVRQNYCDRPALVDTLRQFEFVDAKILGVLLNCTTEEGKSYGYKSYRKYGSRYYGYGQQKTEKK